ncbi:MAG: hypothetical protein QMD66_06145, partial [Actinomycetota bacterium]|nr:hypothetical protein [Actinomycetota bacterium]
RLSATQLHSVTGWRVHPKRTFTSLTMYAHRRTSGRARSISRMISYFDCKFPQILISRPWDYSEIFSDLL